MRRTITLILTILYCILYYYLSQLYSAGSYSTGGPYVVQSPNYKTANITAPVPFADWWTSVLIKKNSDLLPALPINIKIGDFSGEYWGCALYASGIGTFNDTGNHTDSVSSGFYLTQPHMQFRADNWVKDDMTTRADDYSDWSVKLKIDDGTTTVNYVTIIKGCPYVFVDTENCEKETFLFYAGIDKAFTTNSTNIGLSSTRPVTNDHLVFQTGGRYFAVFTTNNAVFKMVNGNKVILSNFNNFFSIAYIKNTNDLTLFYESAYAYISDTAFSYLYNETLSEVTYSFDITTTLRRSGFSDIPLTCLFPHHYKHSSAVTLPTEYQSIRGTLKLFQGKTFQTKLKFEGILPYLPEPTTAGYSRALLSSYITNIRNSITSLGFSQENTYYAGKQLARCAVLIPIAHETGDYINRDTFINLLKTELIDWYTLGGSLYYCYYANWGTMLGAPAGFGTWELNDHHFHHGYFIYASAILSMFDRTFITDYGWLVEHLIRDINSPNRFDAEYAFLNYLDIYEGHSWADGFADFNDGNNEESCSEAMNFWAGIYLWGLTTGQNTYRDLGIMGYTMVNSAIDEYWFDKSMTNFHPTYRAQNVMTCLLWGSMIDHDTWFGQEQEYIHGILWLPVGPSSFYLAYQPAYTKKNYDDMVSKGGPEDRWYDIIWKYIALYDADTAISKMSLPSGVDWDAGLHTGNSDAEIYNFVYNMKSLGTVNTNYSADFSSYNVFTNQIGTSNDITYVAYNPTGSLMDVNFYKNGVFAYKLSNIPPYSIWSSKKPPYTNIAPIPNFWISNVSSLEKIFIATNTYDLEDDKIYYAWDIDGDYTIDLGFSSNLIIVTNIYSTYGTNNVTLWVTDLFKTNSQTRICYRTEPSSGGPNGSPPPSSQEIWIGTNIKQSISYPNPFSLSKQSDVKFGIYENNILKGLPHETKIYIYSINGYLIWESNQAQEYEYNIIRCEKNIFTQKAIKNEVLICVIKHNNQKQYVKLLIIN